MRPFAAPRLVLLAACGAAATSPAATGEHAYDLPLLGWERASARMAEAPTDHDFKDGFRCARSL